MKYEEIDVPTNRRRFLKSAGIAGLGLAGAAVVQHKLRAGVQPVQAAGSNFSDEEIMNFALNLEYLGAEFYAMSTWGATLVDLGVISESETTGPTTGGKMVSGFGSSPLAFLAAAIREDEINHVKLLRSILGTSAAKKPAINLNAKGTITTVAMWAAMARQIEDVDLSAYLGAAPLLTNSSNVATAGALLGTEGQHEGALRVVCIQEGIKSPALDSRDVAPAPGTAMDVDSNGRSIPRSFSQILDLVYAGGTCSGGFFPAGMNGAIVCRS